MLYSYFQDCMLYRHSFKDAFRPASKANPQGVSVNCHGDMLYAKKATVSSPPSSKITGLIRYISTFTIYIILIRI